MIASGVDESESPRCADCGAVLVGRYCHECGDDSRPPSRRLRDIAEDFLEEVFDFSAPALMTARALFTRPSLVPRALRAGDRKSFLSPMKLYLTASLIFFLFLSVAQVTIVQWTVVQTGTPLKVEVKDGTLRRLVNFHMQDVWLHPVQSHQRNEAAVAALDAAIPRITDPAERALQLGLRSVVADPTTLNEEIATWAPRALWLLMPIYALLLWPLYARGRLVSEHVIFALWAHTMLFLLLIAGALWNMTGLTHGLLVALLAYQAYLTLGLKGYYEQSWAGAVVKGALHSFVYVGLIWLPLGIGFLMFSQAHQHLPPGYFSE